VGLRAIGERLESGEPMGKRLLSWPGRVVLALLVVLVPASLGAVTSATNAAAAPVNWTVRVGSQTSNMAIQGERFLPGDVTIDAGDSVTWKAGGAEFHTVTFFDGGAPQETIPGLNPGDPTQVTPQGGTTMGAGYFNSGLLTTLPDAGALQPAPVFKSYTLTFPDPGTFTYYCLVHGIMMRGIVHVQPAATAYPASQADYNAEGALLAQALKADGVALLQKAQAASGPRTVLTGADDGISMIMRFVHHRVVIHKGQKVTFVNSMSMGAPHTVTFGKVPQGLAVFSPSGNPTNYRGGNLHSGIMTPGSKFVVTFNKVGTFPFVCALHRDMGMKGVVVVKP
jgi:plastocyanin